MFHTPFKRLPSDPYLRSLQAAGGNRVFLSLAPVPFDMVDIVYAAARIGLVSFSPVDSNFATTLMSSGKLRYYLRNGLPVVILAACAPPLFVGCGHSRNRSRIGQDCFGLREVL